MTFAVLLLLGMALTADQPFVATVLAVLVAACVVAAFQPADRRPARVLATSLRRRAFDAGVPLLCDPDAPGRARPRAPSA